MQICWTWQKVSSKDDRGFQQFLDNVQYKCSGILRYERVFGPGFVSTGGIGILLSSCRYPLFAGSYNLVLFPWGFPTVTTQYMYFYHLWIFEVDLLS